MAVRVLLRDAEVDVKEQEAIGGRSLRVAAVEQLLQPVRVHESLVVREPLDLQVRLRAPLQPACLVRAHRDLKVLGDPTPEQGRVLAARAVDDDLGGRRQTLVLEHHAELGVVQTRQPLCGQRHGTRDVSSALGTARPPPVVLGKRSQVDDTQPLFAEPRAQLTRS